MKTTVNQDNLIQLEEVYNPIVLKTSSGEEMTISMRDEGFEFKYQGKWYYAQWGRIENLQIPQKEIKNGRNIKQIQL